MHGSLAAEMMSVGSCTSRTSSKLIPSSAELERMYISKKKQELASQRKRNERSCREAIDFPDVGRVRRSTDVTVPQEFNLSCPNTPSRGHSVCSDYVSDNEKW